MHLTKKLQKILIGSMAAMTLMSVPLATITVAAETTKSSANKQTTSNQQQLHLDVKGAIAIDEQTGQVLYSQNATQSIPVASLTKILTLYLVMQAIKDGKLSWNQKVTPSDNVCAVSQDTSLSNVPLEKGQQYTVKSLYEATLIYSANGAAMALAQAVSGSQKKFIDLMRKEVKKMGINDAEIYTCNGLTNGMVKSDAYPGAASKAENKFSAKDMAIISMKLLQQYPEVLKTASITKKEFNTETTTIEMENRNWMLPNQSCSYSLLPVDGLKTGTSDAAGSCFVGTTNRDNHRIITVVLGASHTSDTDPSRFIQTQKLMSYVYHTYNYQTIAKGQKTAKAPVYHGKQLKVKVQNARAEGVWLKKETKVKEITTKVKLKKSLMDKKHTGLMAPLKKNQTVGTMTFAVSGKKIETINQQQGIPVKAQTVQAVKKANIFEIAWRWITNLF